MDHIHPSEPDLLQYSLQLFIDNKLHDAYRILESVTRPFCCCQNPVRDSANEQSLALIAVSDSVLLKLSLNNLIHLSLLVCLLLLLLPLLLLVILACGQHPLNAKP
jgi:hypothetical protein